MADPKKPQQEEISEEDLLSEPAPGELSEEALLSGEESATPPEIVVPAPQAPSNPALRSAIQDADTRAQASDWEEFKKWVGEKTRAGAAGLLNGYTFGNADEVAGLLSAGQGVSRDFRERATNPHYALAVGPPADFSSLYRARRDDYRDKEKPLREENPGMYFGAGILGALMAPSPVPRLGAGSSMGPVQAAIRGGAFGGGLNALGNSEAELASSDDNNEYGRAFVDTGAGAVFGGLLSGGIQGTLGLTGRFAPEYTDRLRQWLAQKAEEKAVKSVTGRNQRAWESMINKDTLHDIGRDLLDEDVVTAGASVEQVRQRAADVAERAGKDINKALSEVDGLVPEDSLPWKYDLAQEIEKRMVRPREQMSAGDLGVAKRLQKEADQIRQHAFPNRPTLSRLEQQKRYLDQFIDFDGVEPPPIQEGLKDLRDFLNANVEQSAWKAAEDAGSDAAERFVRAKELFGNMSAVAAPGLKQQARELSNRMVSASDHGLGATAAMLAKEAGDEPVQAGMKGAAIALANKLFRERGNQVAAVGMDRLSQSDWLRSIATLSPEDLGPWGEQLARAMTRGPGALELEDYLLSQTVPEYAERKRQAMQKANGEQSQ